MMGEFDISGRWSETAHIFESVSQSFQFFGYPRHDRGWIGLVLEEAVIYAIQNGNRNDPHRRIRVVFRTTAERFDVCVTDEGVGGDPADGDSITPEMEGVLRGRWSLAANRYMTTVRFCNGMRSVVMSKVRETSA